ncbi:MAG: hypothetical protein O7D93_06360, partial [Acidobacteria bacterium]|nr:hypothetical protein [Acidobacteriota bacterium]
SHLLRSALLGEVLELAEGTRLKIARQQSSEALLPARKGVLSGGAADTIFNLVLPKCLVS